MRTPSVATVVAIMITDIQKNGFLHAQRVCGSAHRAAMHARTGRPCMRAQGGHAGRQTHRAQCWRCRPLLRVTTGARSVPKEAMQRITKSSSTTRRP
jgi:hypothetical protein